MSSSYAYALLYSDDRIIIAKKNCTGFWFKGGTLRKKSDGFQINGYSCYKNGVKIVNGADLPCLPGGKVEGTESREATAKREMLEETGVNLDEISAISTETKLFPTGDYSVLYTKVEDNQLGLLLGQINGKLSQANSKKEEFWFESKDKNSKPPVDCNELAEVMCVTREEAKNLFSPHKRECGWFLSAVQNIP